MATTHKHTHKGTTITLFKVTLSQWVGERGKDHQINELTYHKLKGQIKRET